MGNAFKALVGEEVFILAPLSESEPLEELIFGESFLFESQVELLDCLNDFDIEQHDVSSILVNGIPVPAINLPATLPEDVDTYLFILRGVEGTLIRIPSHWEVEDLADTISGAIENSPEIDIEDIFLVFGYELGLTLSVREEDLDDQRLEFSREFITKSIDLEDLDAFIGL